MRQALPKGLVRANVYLPGRQTIGFDYLRQQTEASSDSEVVRQALRHFEQWVEDEHIGIRLARKRDGIELIFYMEMFRPPGEAQNEYVRTSLILHEQSMARVERLRTMIGAKDISEVIRCALRFYKIVVTEGAADTRFFAIMPGGERFFVRIGTLSRSDYDAHPTR